MCPFRDTVGETWCEAIPLPSAVPGHSTQVPRQNQWNLGMFQGFSKFVKHLLQTICNGSCSDRTSWMAKTFNIIKHLQSCQMEFKKNQKTKIDHQPPTSTLLESKVKFPDEHDMLQGVSAPQTDSFTDRLFWANLTQKIHRRARGVRCPWCK